VKQFCPALGTATANIASESSETLDKANERLLEQLFCVDYKSARLRPQLPQGRTCQWIFNDPTYISWLQSEKPSMILLTGSAGTGKSVMTRYVTESILSGNQTEGTGMDYLGISFFCSYNEALVSDEVTVLRSLLHQLIQINGHCASIVRSYLEKRKYHGMEISFKAADLWASLFGVLSMTTMQRVYIAIDAIEELGPYVATSLLTGLWKTMSALQCDYPESRLRIFVSSRFKPPPDAPGLSSLTMLSMNMSHIQTDITLFLRDAVDDLAYRSAGFKAALSPASQHQIVNSIAAKAEGRFLQAVLMWEDFRRGLIWNQNVIMQKLKRLGALGSGMVALYNKIIDAMDDVTRDDAFTIFSVLAAAAQPLSEIELGTIIGMNHSSKPIVKSSDIEPIRDLYQVMEENFPDLVSIQDDNRVIFVHHSFREYLDQREEFRDRLFSGHRKITRACLKYLKLADMLDSAKTNGSACKSNVNRHIEPGLPRNQILTQRIPSYRTRAITSCSIFARCRMTTRCGFRSPTLRVRSVSIRFPRYTVAEKRAAAALYWRFSPGCRPPPSSSSSGSLGNTDTTWTRCGQSRKAAEPCRTAAAGRGQSQIPMNRRSCCFASAQTRTRILRPGSRIFAWPWRAKPWICTPGCCVIH